MQVDIDTDIEYKLHLVTLNSMNHSLSNMNHTTVHMKTTFKIKHQTKGTSKPKTEASKVPYSATSISKTKLHVVTLTVLRDRCHSDLKPKQEQLLTGF